MYGQEWKNINEIYKKDDIICCPFFICYSQISVKDSLSLESVSFVEIYSENGSLVGVSDQDGFISDELIKEMNDSLSKYQGIAYNYSQPIIDNVAEAVAGI